MKNYQAIIRVNSQAGFTMMEAIVSAAVFAFVVSSVMGVYLSAIKIDSKTRSERTIQQNARFIMDFLGKEIRNGSIDYNGYGGLIIPDADGSTDEVYLINQLNETERVFCNGQNLSLTKASGTTNLNSSGALITRCKFYISPLTDPFQPLGSLPPPPNQQPFVTVVLQISSQGARASDQAQINLQSTFTVRDYPSRE